MIVDDHQVVREGLSSFLRAVADLELVAVAPSGQEALRVGVQSRPDVVLMDIVMPDQDGIVTAEQLLDHLPDVKIIMLSSFGEEHRIQAAFESGAVGYLLKDATIQEMEAAIRAAMQGQKPVSPQVTQTLLEARDKPAFNLKDRELEVLRLLAEGKTNRSIAYELSLSVSTIKFHVSNILVELNAESRTEAVAIALQHDLIDMG
ncbi:MAG: response regulator transcription factor [Chloroflexi bacterium]|nr:response regulator transcription factor [Chloroflexota bacterium]